MPENRIIIVAGPTASGKSALAVDIASALGGVVVNCDSMQVYQSMPVISACPSAQEKSKAEHRLFEIYPPQVRGNVVDWLKLAVEEIKDIWRQKKIPIVVGGTGLYIDNLINGTTPIPETKAEIRQEVAEYIKSNGSAALYDKLCKIDPETAEKLNPADICRVSRAFEVWEDTGIKLSEWHKKPMVKQLPDAKFFVFKICPSAKELDTRCYLRFEKMLEAGALDEARYLAGLDLDASLPAMKALGVPELLNYVRGNCSLSEAADSAKLHTRQYAKRQRTWFKNKLKADVELSYCYCGEFEQIEPYLSAAGFVGRKSVDDLQ